MNKNDTKQEQSDAARLAELNRRFKKYESAAEKLSAEYAKAFAEMDDRFCGIRKAAEVARANFNLLRQALPKTKFNLATGEYFYANEDGKEVFAVRVRKTFSHVFTVCAKSSAEAEAIAEKMAKANPQALQGSVVLEAEDVSR